MIRFHKRMEAHKNRGFSLIELIIAIAILVILTGFLAPQFMRYIEKSRESVCRKNMDEMLNIYRMEFVGNDKYTVVKVLEEYKDREPCPSGGEYVDGTEKMTIPWIFCKLHDSETLKETPEVIIAKKIYNEMVQFAGMSSKEIEKILVEQGYQSPYIHASNDNLRKYLFEKVFNGAWPTITVDGKTVYVQPYINITTAGSAATTENSVSLFANANGSIDDKNWNSSLIYADGVWYKPGKDSMEKAIMVAGKDCKTIKNEIDEDNWVPID